MSDTKDNREASTNFYCGSLEAGLQEEDRKETVKELQRGILLGSDNLDWLLWQAVIAYQNYLFCTASGLPFSYIVKRCKDGSYSGELLVSRKEGSKTLTKSSVLLAFHKVLENMRCVEQAESSNLPYRRVLLPLEYSGPKAIGQIFGISYVYSLFMEFGLIKVPEKVEERMRNCKTEV
ncbi:MAG: hypothetical protein ACI39H_02945 [Lachnospiraceae bacterium]